MFCQTQSSLSDLKKNRKRQILSGCFDFQKNFFDFLLFSKKAKCVEKASISKSGFKRA